MIRAFLLGMAGALAVFMGAEVLAHGLGYEHRGGMANGPRATALSPYGSSQQAVSPVPASIAFAGEN